MTSTTRKPLTAQERQDHHAAYHVWGMMDRDCDYCTAVRYLGQPEWRCQRGISYQEYFVGGK